MELSLFEEQVLWVSSLMDLTGPFRSFGRTFSSTNLTLKFFGVKIYLYKFVGVFISSILYLEILCSVSTPCPRTVSGPNNSEHVGPL